MIITPVLPIFLLLFDLVSFIKIIAHNFPGQYWIIKLSRGLEIMQEIKEQQLKQFCFKFSGYQTLKNIFQIPILHKTLLVIQFLLLFS